MPSCGRRTRILHGEGSHKGPDLGGKVVPMGAELWTITGQLWRREERSSVCQSSTLGCLHPTAVRTLATWVKAIP